jgi:hypothetical protein
MAPAPNGVATGLSLDLVFVDACKAAVGGSDHCWPTVQSWRNACCGVWALRGLLKPCACTGGPSLRSAWRMSMGWLVWNWGERWAHQEWVVPIGALNCSSPMALSEAIAWRDI